MPNKFMWGLVEHIIWFLLSFAIGAFIFIPIVLETDNLSTLWSAKITLAVIFVLSAIISNYLIVLVKRTITITEIKGKE